MSVDVSNRVYVQGFESKDSLAVRLADAFSWLGDGLVRRGDRVFVKPNLTYPYYKPGVTTSPEMMEALVQVLSSCTSNITFVESDGGVYAWPAQQAMEGHGIADLCKRYGAKMLNLSERPRRMITNDVDGRSVSIELSAEMLDESDLFITMPVPKVHAMTYLTLGFKNQWGCVPDVKRLLHHSEFDHKIIAVNEALRTRIALFDGTYFLNRSGPMEGDAVRMNLFVLSDGIGAGSMVCCDLMQISPTKSSHLRLAHKLGLMPFDLKEMDLNCDLASFKREPFYLQRTWLNWVALAAFHSRLITKLGYDSAAAKPLHDLLYMIRGKPKDVSPKWGRA